MSVAFGVVGVAAPSAKAGMPVLEPKSLDTRPAGFGVTPREARATAEANAAVEMAHREYSALRAKVIVPQYFGDQRYEVV